MPARCTPSDVTEQRGAVSGEGPDKHWAVGGGHEEAQ